MGQTYVPFLDVDFFSVVLCEREKVYSKRQPHINKKWFNTIHYVTIDNEKSNMQKGNRRENTHAHNLFVVVSVVNL